MCNITAIKAHQQKLRSCRLCPKMVPPVITCQPICAEILLIGQAPGNREGELGQPFAWTAGKTLFKWFASIGISEQDFRKSVYISAVCRCFPGKNPNGGDRVPNRTEINTCKHWLHREIELLQPKLLLPVGRLAISQYLPTGKLTEVIGRKFHQRVHAMDVDIIPLPHPSGASTWHRMSPGKELLEHALALLSQHASWKKLAAR